MNQPGWYWVRKNDGDWWIEYYDPAVDWLLSSTSSYGPEDGLQIAGPIPVPKEDEWRTP